MHPADYTRRTGNPWRFEPESASARATRDARVIHMPRRAGQERPPESPPAPRKAPGGLAAEAQAAGAVLKAAAEGSDWAAEAMTPVAAWSQTFPHKGEAGNWIIWSGMTFAGVSRGLLVSLGYLIARGGETRIRAGVATGVLFLALTISYLAGHLG
jgi:hypothetical protein